MLNSLFYNILSKRYSKNENTKLEKEANLIYVFEYKIQERNVENINYSNTNYLPYRNQLLQKLDFCILSNRILISLSIT